MRFLQASAARQGCWCICTAAGWFLGPAGGARERFCSDGTRLEGSSLQSRRLHRQSRRHQAGGALEGERNRSALHLAIAIRLRSRNANSCEVTETVASKNGSTAKASLIDLSCLPRLSLSRPRPADGFLGRFLNFSCRARRGFMIRKTSLRRSAAQPASDIRAQHNHGVRSRRIADSRDGPRASPPTDIDLLRQGGRGKGEIGAQQASTTASAMRPSAASPTGVAA